MYKSYRKCTDTCALELIFIDFTLELAIEHLPANAVKQCIHSDSAKYVKRNVYNGYNRYRDFFL